MKLIDKALVLAIAFFVVTLGVVLLLTDLGSFAVVLAIIYAVEVLKK